MVKSLHFRNIALKLFFPLIYAVFFVVQCVCNFDTVPYKELQFQARQSTGKVGFFAGFEKSKSDMPLKLKFHLNKRFQPTFISHTSDLPSTPVIVFEFLQQRPYNSPYIKGYLSHTRSLRGPPAVS